MQTKPTIRERGNEIVQTATGQVQIRVYWTTQEGDRGVYWRWSEVGTAWEDRGEWSYATGPFATSKEPASTRSTSSPRSDGETGPTGSPKAMHSPVRISVAPRR